MSRLLLGTILGLIFGAVSVLMMLPMKFEDKRAAMAGSFINRFAICFVTGAAALPIPFWASGLVFGILLSLPEAIITKAWIPILALGAVIGLIAGLVMGMV